MARKPKARTQRARPVEGPPVDEAADEAIAPPPAPGSPAEAAPTGAWALLRGGGRELAALLVVAMGVKLLVVMAALADDPLAHYATSDSRFYLERAAGIDGRIQDPLADEPHHLPPLYPQLLARLPGALDGDFTAVFLTQALFGALALAAVFVLARRRVSRNAALAAVGLTLLYAPLSFFEVKLLGDSLATSLTLLALVCADALASQANGQPNDRPRTLAAVCLGLLVGIATLLRPQLMLLVPVFVLWLWLRAARGPAAALVVTACLVLLPSTLHNHTHGAPLTPVSDNGGVNLWLANTGPLSGTFDTSLEAFGDIERQADSARRVAEGIAGRPLDPGEVSSTLRQAAWSEVLDDPARFVARVGLRARALLENFETGIVCVPEVEGRLIPPLAVLALPFGVLLALGLAGLVLAGTRRPRAPLVPMLAVAGVVVLTTLMFFHYSRFRLPLAPLLALSSVCGWEALRRGVPGGRLALAIAVGLGGAGLSWWPGSHHAETLAIGWTSLSEARLALADPRDPEAALTAAQDDIARALEASPGLLRAQLQAARVAFARGRFDATAHYLDRAAAIIGDHPQVLMTRAWLHARPHPDNRHYDPQAARALLAPLRLAALTDDSLAETVRALEAALPPSADG